MAWSRLEQASSGYNLFTTGTAPVCRLSLRTSVVRTKYCTWNLCYQHSGFVPRPPWKTSQYCSSSFVLAPLIRQRIRAHLELHQLTGGPFAALHVEWGSRRDWRVDTLSLPATVRIIDPAVQAFRVEAHGIRHAQRYELAV